MSQDLEEYQDIIEQLKPMINEPEFNQALAQVASTVPKQKRFLIKMELKRLARPCIRLIDLRGQVDGECREYEYEGKRHFLDETAIEVFERQVRSFGDYTIGVYEAVKNTENNFRVMYQKQKVDGEDELTQKEIEPLNAEVVHFGSFAQRSEERMNYSVNIEMFTDTNKSIPATTVDMSVSGLKVKINQKHTFKSGDMLTVQFRGLEGEYTLDKKNGVPYLVVAIDNSRKEMRVSLKRVFDNPIPSFDAFLEKFIHGNKRRYKVNLDNTLDAIRFKSFEQYYTPNFVSVPIYIEEVENNLQPVYALANDCNRDVYYYWTDEQHELRLGYLLSHERITRLLSTQESRHETYVYAFNHVKDEKVYFYSATRDELLDDPQMMQVFLGYGARKASWRVYKLQLSPVTLEQAHVPLSIPDSVNETVKRQNQPPPPRLLARLKNIKYVALLTDITDDYLTAKYENLPIKRNQIANLKLFGHPRNKPPAAVSMFRFKYHNQRKETRYQLRTKVQIKSDDIVLEGVSEDVSIRGMKIELHSFFHDVENAEIKVTFPQLQKVTQKYDLTDLLYRVKGISRDRNVLHLQAVNDLANTTAQRFFEELIKKNKSRLKAYREEEEIPGIGTALRNLYSQNIQSCGFCISKHGVELLPDMVTTANTKTRLHHFLTFDTEPGHANLSFLYNLMGKEKDFISTTLKNIKTSRRPIMRELFVAFNPTKSVKSGAIVCQFVDRFKKDEQRKAFISKAMNEGQFLSLKIFLARTGRPDTDKLQSEIAYVGVYAVHRAKVLEEQLWSVIGVGDIHDVTDDALQRYGYAPDQIEANYELPKHEMKADNIKELLKA